MSCTTLIGQSQSNYKLACALVNALSEQFNFSSDDAWSVVSNRTHDQLAKKFKRQRRKDDPFSSITKPRQAYSFYTKMNYATVSEQNKDKELGDISKLISAQWKRLGKKEKQRYMDMQTEDKERYTRERSKLEAQLATTTPPVVEETTTTTAETPAPVETPRRRRKKVETTTEETTDTPVKSKRSSKGKKKTSSGRKHRRATATTA